MWIIHKLGEVHIVVGEDYGLYEAGSWAARAISPILLVYRHRGGAVEVVMDFNTTAVGENQQQVPHLVGSRIRSDCEQRIAPRAWGILVAATLIEGRKVELIRRSGGIAYGVETACRTAPVAFVGVVTGLTKHDIGAGTAGELVLRGVAREVIVEAGAHEVLYEGASYGETPVRSGRAEGRSVAVQV